MKKMNKGAISIFALLSMMFFLIFIMVAYNNVSQKGKNQVETQEILVDYYKSTRSAQEIYNDFGGDDGSGTVTSSTANDLLKDSNQKGKISGNNGKYIYSNGKIYKIGN